MIIEPRSADAHSWVTVSAFSCFGRRVILRVGVVWLPVCPAFPLGVPCLCLVRAGGQGVAAAGGLWMVS